MQTNGTRCSKTLLGFLLARWKSCCYYNCVVSDEIRADAMIPFARRTIPVLALQGSALSPTLDYPKR